MIKNKIQHERNRFVSVKYASSREKNYFNNKIKNIVGAVLVSRSTFNEAYQPIQIAVELIINNIY